MATLNEVQKLIQDTYQNIWSDWYKNHVGCIQASITIDLNGLDDGYSHSSNIIVIAFGECNLEDSDMLDASQWPIWKTSLVHEMLHEYEKKVLTEPSDEGRGLFAKHPHPWWGPGHEEMFYTAICDRALYFGMTPEQLIGHI